MCIDLAGFANQHMILIIGLVAASAGIVTFGICEFCTRVLDPLLERRAGR
jgi:hypothetical protein